MKSLDAKLAEIKASASARAFILADAKDADMAFGVRAPGPRSYLARRGERPARFSPEVWTRDEFTSCPIGEGGTGFLATPWVPDASRDVNFYVTLDEECILRSDGTSRGRGYWRAY